MVKIKEHLKNESKILRDQVRERTLNFILAAFGFVAGLAWNEAIQALINTYVKFNKNSVAVKFFYAILITLILVIVTVYLSRIFGKKEEK